MTNYWKNSREAFFFAGKKKELLQIITKLFGLNSQPSMTGVAFFFKMTWAHGFPKGGAYPSSAESLPRYTEAVLAVHQIVYDCFFSSLICHLIVLQSLRSCIESTLNIFIDRRRSRSYCMTRILKKVTPPSKIQNIKNTSRFKQKQLWM